MKYDICYEFTNIFGINYHEWYADEYKSWFVTNHVHNNLNISKTN